MQQTKEAKNNQKELKNSRPINDESEFKIKSTPSISSSVDSRDGGLSNGRELTESLSMKLLSIKSLLVSTICNCLLLLMFITLHSTNGFHFTFAGSLLQQIGSVLVQTICHFCYLLTKIGLEEATAVYFGWLLSQKQGYSLAICGYAHSSLFKKIFFPNILSYRSKCKKFLQNMSYLWMLFSALIVLTVFASTGVSFAIVRENSTSYLSCVIYSEDGELFDRGFPVIEVPMGVGEYVFGSALGIIRSEVSTSQEFSTHVFPPQLTDSLNDGTTTRGRGFATNIKTECRCLGSFSTNEMVIEGIPLEAANTFINISSVQRKSSIMYNYIQQDSDETLLAFTLLSGNNVCTGTSSFNLPIPLCKTIFFNHSNAEVQSEYMTDGTTASIAIKNVTLIEVLESGNISWVYQSLKNILGGQISAIPMYETFPGIVNPILLWTSVDNQLMTASLLNTGLETTWAIIMRSAFQRTFAGKSDSCAQNVISQNSIVMMINDQSYVFGLVFVIGVLCVNFICLAASSVWFFSTNPIKPSILMISSKSYFSLMLSNPLTANFIKGNNMFTTETDTWDKLDIIVRIGEAIGTKDDPEFGKITMDKPKMVTSFTLAKRYS